MRPASKGVAIDRQKVDMLDYIVLHSSHLHEIVSNRQGLSDDAPAPNITAKLMSSVVAINFGEQVGTLHEAKIGSGTVPAAVTFHAGVIKYCGDVVLRADRHLLLRLTALLIRLLDAHAGGGRSAEEVIKATKAAARKIGLDWALKAARDRVEKRESALNNLQSLSTMIRRANVTYDEEIEQVVINDESEEAEQISSPKFEHMSADNAR